MKLYLRHAEKGTRYLVVRLDPKDTKDRKITLKGAHDEFVEAFDPTRFKKMGYELVQEQEQ